MFKFIRDMKIRIKLFGMFLVSLSGFIALFLLGYRTLDFVKVNGPIYKNIRAGKDIIADVLPPPKYIIESYLICNHVFFEKYPEDIPEMKKLFRKLQHLKEEYYERQEVWLKELTPGELKTELVELSHNPVEKFFQLVDEEFIPLVLAGELDQARKVLDDKLEPLYEEHRKHIDQVVRLASAANEHYEEDSRRLVSDRIGWMIILEILLICIDIILITRFVRMTTFPLMKLAETAKKISEGDLSGGGIVSDANDETGMLARAIEEMRIALRSTLSGLKDEIDRRKKTEDDLRDARDNLEDKVQERTAELEEANEALHKEIEEHKKLQKRLDTQYRVARFLAEAKAFSDISFSILESAGQNLNWVFGEIWLVDQEAGLLRCFATWYDPVNGLAEFDADSRQRTFSVGEGLPGRAWANKEPVWVTDLSLDSNFLRGKIASLKGLRSGFAFPIRIGDEILGVFSFFSLEIRLPDYEVILMFTALGSQIGQFIERKRAEEDLVKLNQSLESRIVTRTKELEFANKGLVEANFMATTLLEAIPFVMDIVDEQGTVLRVSPKLEAITGKGVLGGKCWEFYRDNKRQCLDCPLRKEIRIGQTAFIETSGVFGGRIFSISHTGMIYQGKKAVLEIFQDITERKQSEEELIKAHEELKSTQAQLVQSAKMASVGQLAGGVAHEINNPLTGVLNNVQLIKMELADKVDFKIDDFKELLDIIEESAQRCAKITRSLLEFSRSPKETLAPVSLNEAVEKVAALISHELKLQNIIIEKQLEPDLPPASGNFQLLQQCIFDIITNARWAIRKKSENAGGVITIKTHYDDHLGKTVNISISDTGVGIARENLGKIFEPFFTTKPVGEGTGLGLSIVYNIIKEHNGIVTVESEPGQGAVFKISLPAIII